MISKVTGKNQITIPATIARKMGIVSGTELEWELAPNHGTVRLRVKPTIDMVLREIQELGGKYNVDPASALAKLEQLRDVEEAELMTKISQP